MKTTIDPVPREVRAYIRKNDYKRLALCVASIVVLFIPFALGAFDSLGRFNVWALYLVCAIACVVFIIKPNRLADRSFEGVVTDILVDTKITSDTKSVRVGRLQRTITKTLVINLDNGKTKMWELDDRLFLKHTDREPYSIGDRVRYLRGTKVLYRIGGDSKMCVICGTNNPADHKKCGSCGISLMRD